MNLIANHVALNARITGSNEHESHSILDLLHNNTSEIKLDILSTDTHGVNHVNFALLDLFGYQFAPRYAELNTVISDLFEGNEGDDNKTTISLKKPINTTLIIEQSETVQRIVISLQQKTLTQATLVRKLSGYNRNHPLLKAMYLLDYIGVLGTFPPNVTLIATAFVLYRLQRRINFSNIFHNSLLENHESKSYE